MKIITKEHEHRGWPLVAVSRSIAQRAFDQWQVRYVRSHQEVACSARGSLTILDEFIQLKGVTDGVHDSVLQH